jgi:hypothetical protein
MTNIRMERDGAIGTITIDRVNRFNSLDVATARDLRKAALQYARDDSIAVVILTGAGLVFCSGADLKYIVAGGADQDLAYLQPEARGPRIRRGVQADPEYPHARSRISAHPSRSSRRWTASPRRADSGWRCRAISSGVGPREPSGHRRPDSRARRLHVPAAAFDRAQARVE